MAPAVRLPACLLLFLLFGTLASLRIESEMCEQILLAAATTAASQGAVQLLRVREDVQGRSQAVAKPLNPTGLIKETLRR